MGKPTGLTAALQVVHPSAWEDAVWDAVEKCVECGVSPERFLAEVAESWADALRREAKHAARVFGG